MAALTASAKSIIQGDQNKEEEDNNLTIKIPGDELMRISEEPSVVGTSIDSDDEREMDNGDHSQVTGEAKWWHVQDQQIEEMLLHMDDSSIGLDVSKLMRRPSKKNAKAKTTARKKNRRSIRFEDDDPHEHQDVLDLLIETGESPSTSVGHSPTSEPAERQKRWWTISDKQLEEYVYKIGRSESDTLLAHGGHAQGSPSGSISRSPSESSLARSGRAQISPSSDSRRSSVESLKSDSSLDQSSFSVDSAQSKKKRQIHVHLHRLSRSDPIPCVHTGRRHTAASKSQELITVYVDVPDVQGAMAIIVHPDTRIGPDKAPAPNRFHDVFGRGASTKGFLDKKKSYDYKRRVWGPTVREGFRPAWEESLKGLIEDITGIAVEKQRLLYHGSPIRCDEMTVRSYGITHGQTVTLALKKEHVVGRDEVMLACTAKAKTLEETTKTLHTMLSKLNTVKKADLVKDRSPPRAMPKMVFHQLPNHFSETGSGREYKGGKCPFKQFGEYGTWHQDQFDAKMTRLREGPTFSGTSSLNGALA